MVRNFLEGKLTSFNVLFFSFQAQFVAIFTHQFQLLFTECNYPKGFMVWIALHGIMFLFLFSDFYKVKYSHKKAVKSKENNGACMVSKISRNKIHLCYYNIDFLFTIASFGR